jgi:hypothetical protein
VVECIHCGECLESIFADEPMRCPQNPDTSFASCQSVSCQYKQ